MTMAGVKKRAGRATIVDLEAAVIGDYAVQGVERQTVRKAERLFGEMLRDGLGVHSLGELDDEAIVVQFEKLLTRRGFTPGSRETWQKLLHTVRECGHGHGYLEQPPRRIRSRSRRGQPPDLLAPNADFTARLARVFREVRGAQKFF